jgi:hypothetical protein
VWEAVFGAFFAGVFGANGVPHFVRGITGNNYPCVLGNSSIPNLIAGWASFVVAALLAYWSDAASYPLPSFIGGALGVLLMGLFHSAGLAFGRKT